MSLTAAQICRFLQLTAGEFGRDVYWYLDETGQLHFSIDCSDFFDLATADAEPVETEADLILLEDLKVKLGNKWDDWGGELYAATRRKRLVTRPWMNPENQYYPGDEIAALFREAAQ